MSTFTVRLPPNQSEPQTYVKDAPIDFDAWVKLSEQVDSELIRGVVVERMVAYYPHESIFAWLHTILHAFCSSRKIGKVLGSRTAVRITPNDGRLPDILFVRAENEAIIHKDAIYRPPDLIIEIVSDNDTPRYLMHLETDYRSIGVPNIVFIDPPKERVKYTAATDSGYETQYLTDGQLTFASIPGFEIDVAWLFDIDRPDPLSVAMRLVGK